MAANINILARPTILGRDDRIPPRDEPAAPLILYLLSVLVGLPMLPRIGNLMLSRGSFLVSMRYYAGNWAWDAWFFRRGSARELRA